MTDQQSPAIAKAIDLYMAYQMSAKLSANTTDTYRAAFKAIGKYIGDLDVMTVDQLDKHVMRTAFAAYSEHSRASIENRHSVWRSFFDFLVEDNYIAGNPMGMVKRARKKAQQPKALKNWDEIIPDLLKKIHDGCRKGRTDWPELDFAIFSTLLATGVRANEFLAMNVNSFEGVRGDQSVRVIGKGEVERTIPIAEDLEDALGIYLQSRKDRYPAWRQKDKDSLWVAIEPKPKGQGGARMNRQQLYYVVKTCIESAGYGNNIQVGAMIHGLRHTFGTTLANEGVPIMEIKKLMGHASVNTSQGYIDVLGKEVRVSASRSPIYGAIRKAMADDEPEDE